LPDRFRSLLSPATSVALGCQSIWLLLACIAWCVGLLTVGLWPFNFLAHNRVSWLEGGPGLRFEGPGQVYAEVPWRMSQQPTSAGSFTLELWLQPQQVCDCLGTILSWYDPAQRRTFAIEQSVSDLVVRGYFLDGQRHPAYRSLWLDNRLQANQPIFLTVTTGPEGTVLYLGGARARRYPYAPLINNLDGRLLLGHSAEGRSEWAGDILGLAVYDHPLTPEDVLRHYQSWSEGRLAELKTPDIVGLYPFSERRGQVIHNRAGSMPDLAVPARFSLLRKIPLVRSFKLHRSDLKDAAINITGFIPFGFLISAYLHWGCSFSRLRGATYAVTCGALISLLIEVLQVYLPSRDSSLLDLMNNTIGTALGVAALGWIMQRFPTHAGALKKAG